MNQPKYTIHDIARIVNGKVIGSNYIHNIHYLVTDSRKITFPEESIFFALNGPQHNGHLFISKAMDAGINCFVVSDEKSITQNNGSFVLVKDTTVALQKLAAYHRSLFSIPVIGITGSNGKTIVKDWLAFVLSAEYNVCKNPKSYNSQIGVPLSIWNLDAEHEIGIFEAGISESGEMTRLEPIISPNVGIFTNIGSAHDENFDSDVEKIREKLLLFKNSSHIVLSTQNPAIQKEIEKVFPDKLLITWGESEGAQYKVAHKKATNKTEIFVTDGDDNYSFIIPYSDSASIENAIHVFITSLFLNVDIALVINQMLYLPKVNMRLSFKQGKNNCFIIDDTYSNDFDSLKIAIDSLYGLQQYPRKTIILSDIAQSKGDVGLLYQQIAAITKQKNITQLIGVGEEISTYAHLFPANAVFVKDVHTLIQQLPSITFNNEAILIKGARIFELEKVVSLLESRHHDTVLEVNLNAMIHNLNYFRKIIPAGTKIMAMVKASGYGTGSQEISHVLNFNHVNYLGVAYADEGVELRRNGIKLPVMVMNAEETSFEVLTENQLEPVIYNFESLHALINHQRNGGIIPPIHIEVDSGMHRLGFNPDSITELEKILSVNKSVIVRSVFSHLAAADEPTMDEFTLQQINTYKGIADRIENTIGNSVIKHIANSAGASRFKEAAFDMIRLGVGLYGIGADALEQSKLQPVISLFSTIAQLTEVKIGESVGYGRSFIASENMKIATVPIGYADGFRRSLGNGIGKMFISGKEAKVVGRVCMDMTMIDVTGIDVEVGDRVEVIGESQPIEVLAQLLNTIPYEVLTSISQRVRRIYTQE